MVTASKESNMKSDRAGAIMNANRDMISNTPTISRSISDIMRLSHKVLMLVMVLQSVVVIIANHL